MYIENITLAVYFLNGASEYYSMRLTAMDITYDNDIRLF